MFDHDTVRKSARKSTMHSIHACLGTRDSVRHQDTTHTHVRHPRPRGRNNTPVAHRLYKCGSTCDCHEFQWSQESKKRTAMHSGAHVAGMAEQWALQYPQPTALEPTASNVQADKIRLEGDPFRTESKANGPRPIAYTSRKRLAKRAPYSAHTKPVHLPPHGSALAWKAQPPTC